jgi:hypothetical protein
LYLCNAPGGYHCVLAGFTIPNPPMVIMIAAGTRKSIGMWIDDLIEGHLIHGYYEEISTARCGCGFGYVAVIMRSVWCNKFLVGGGHGLRWRI